MRREDLPDHVRRAMDELEEDLLAEIDRVLDARGDGLEQLREVAEAVAQLAGTEDVSVEWRPHDPETVYVKVRKVLPWDAFGVGMSFDG